MNFWAFDIRLVALKNKLVAAAELSSLLLLSLLLRENFVIVIATLQAVAAAAAVAKYMSMIYDSRTGRIASRCGESDMEIPF